MVRAKVVKDPDGVHRIFVQRAKYKHWFELGTHKTTTVNFYQHLVQGDIAWEQFIWTTDTLFSNNYQIKNKSTKCLQKSK